MLEMDKALFRKQCSRFAPLLSRRMLFQAGLLELQSIPKIAPFFTEEGMQSKKDSRWAEIEGREGLQ